MIASIGANLPNDLLAMLTPDASVPGVPPPGSQASAVPVGNTQGPRPKEPTDAEAEKAAEQAAQAQDAALSKSAASGTSASIHPSDVHFVRDPDTKMVAVQIRDSVTGEEIAQIPSDKMLKTMASIDQAIGMLLDKKA
jgi:uncharacterized FlaG/YvyC family protein